MPIMRRAYNIRYVTYRIPFYHSTWYQSTVVIANNSLGPEPQGLKDAELISSEI